MDSSNLRSGSFFTATVISTDPTAYIVQLATHGANKNQLVQGIPLASTMAKLFGFKQCLLPSVGSNVFCYSIGFLQCLILGQIPDKDDLTTYPLRSIVGAGDGLNDAQNTLGYVEAASTKTFLINQNRPTDIVEGEYALVNEFGVMLGLFQQLAVLKGSDLAQVQTFLFDDLVRIISHNFQHYTALGEYKVFHDGKNLQIEFGLTHNPNEALGSPQISNESNVDSIFHTGKTLPDDTEDFYKLKNDKQIGIERLKGFIGSISNLINFILVRPAEGTIRTLDGSNIALPDKGLAGFNVGLDGRVQVSSLQSIALEKSNWIRVPHRIRTPEDPEGNTDTSPTNIKSFKFDDKYKFEGQPFLYFLQIRDYISYFQDGVTYQRFKDNDKDFYVNDDFSKETKLIGEQKIDPTQSSTFIEKSSGLYLMPNGGIVLRDAWGSAIVMEGGNIYLQPAKDLVSQPMRHMIAKVGGSLSTSVKNNIDFSSTDGSARIKTNESIYLYSDSSGIILHANATAPSEFFPNDGSSEIVSVGGIVLTAPQSGIFSYGKYGYDRVAGSYSMKIDGTALIEGDQLLLQSNNNLLLSCSDSVLIGAGSNIQITSEGSAVIFGVQNTVLGIKDQTYGIAKFGEGGLPVQGVLEQDAVTRFLQTFENIDNLSPEDITPIFKEDDSFLNLIFKFPNSSTYQLITDQDIFPQTIAQQENEQFDLHSFTPWVEKSVNDSYPYPGKDFAETYITSIINNLEVTDDEIHNKPSEHETDMNISVPKNIFNDYKIYG